MTYPTITPKLTLDFVNSRQLDPRITFSRSSTATYLHPDTGLITTAPNGVARFEKEGFLIEESRTNVAPRSQEFTNSAWFKTGMTATDNVAVAPDGTTTAATLMDNGTDNVHHGLYQAQASRTDFTQSFFVKPNGNNYVNLRASGADGWHTITFALIGDGSVTQSLAASNSPYTNVSGKIIALPNGWYRISMSATRPAGTAYVLNLDAATGATETLRSDYGIQQTYTSNTSKGYYIWGGQLEEKVFPTSYIPTTSSTVTRAADTVSLTGTNFSSWYNGSQGSIFIDMKRPAVSSNSGAFLEFFDNAGYFLQDINNVFAMRIGKEGTINLGPTTTTDYKIASSYQSETNYNTSSNGSTPVSTSTLVDFTTATELHIGRGNNAFTAHYRNGPRTLHLKRFVYYDRRASDAELQTLTS